MANNVVDGIEVNDNLKGSPAFDAEICYDVMYYQFMVKRFYTESEAVAFANAHEQAWQCLQASFPGCNIPDGGCFSVSKHWSCVFK
jgi:hypothetical protein